MFIREIEAQDDGVIKDVIQRSLADVGLDVPGTAYYDPQLESLTAFYGSTHGAYFVACDDSGRVVGGAGYAPIDEDGHDAAERIAELQKLYVSKESRGLGASYRLIDAVESHARRDGYTTLYLETHHVLEAAMHVYERRGFQLIDAPLGHAQHTTMDRFYIKSLA